MLVVVLLADGCAALTYSRAQIADPGRKFAAAGHDCDCKPAGCGAIQVGPDAVDHERDIRLRQARCSAAVAGHRAILAGIDTTEMGRNVWHRWILA